MHALRKRQGVGGSGRLKKAERKSQILRHAKELFVTLGYQHTTTDKIARAAGVTEPVLYRHFASKKVLFLEVLDEVRKATLERWLQTSKLPDPLTRLQSIVDLYLGSTREQAVELRIMHRTLIEVEDAEIAASLRSFYLDTERLLADVISDGQREGIFRPELDARLVAWDFIRNALGFSLTEPLGVPFYQEDHHLRRTTAFMIGCLLAR